jgi:transposase
MQRRKFSRDFKVEAVKLVRERGVSAAQAACDLDVHENVLRKWVKEFGSDPVQAYPGHGQMKPEGDRAAQAQGREAEGRAGYPKKAAAFFAKEAT